MLASKNRFHGTNSLNYVYRNGKTLRTKYMAVKYCPNSRRDTYRIAVVVSRKVAKSAPVRNRIRRRIYELFRTQQIAGLSNLDIVVTVFDENVAELSAENLKNTVDQLVSDMTSEPQ